MAIDTTKLLTSKALEGKAILGRERVLKELKAGRLGTVFLAQNCPQKVKDDVQYYARLAAIPVIQLEQSNEEIGVLCKKNFFISVAGIA